MEVSFLLCPSLSLTTEFLGLKKLFGGPLNCESILFLVLGFPGVEMRRIELGTLMTDRAAYITPSQQGDKPDQIEVPVEEMERLSMKGVKDDSASARCS